MINLLQITKIELFKTSKLSVFWMLLLLPVLTTIFVGYIMYAQISKGMLVGDNFWRQYINYFFSIYSFLLPIVQSVAASAQVGLEYRSNAFQMLYTLPARRRNVLISKLLTHILWTFLFLLFTFAFILFSGAVLLRLYPDATFFEFDLHFHLFQLFVKVFLACVTIGIIHLFLSYGGISSQISILLASFATIISILSVNWRFAYLNPYSWIFRFTRDFIIYEENKWFTNEIYTIVFYTITFVFATLIVNKYNKKLTL